MQKTAFSQAHPELWKLIKFSVAGGLATGIELAVYYLLQALFRAWNTEPFRIWLFEYQGIGYLWAFLISTTIGYAIAFFLNRKVTFRADANPALSIFLYVIMVLFTICATAWMGTALLNFCIQRDMRQLGEIMAKPLVAAVTIVWTYPINRFVIHRRKKPSAL